MRYRWKMTDVTDTRTAIVEAAAALLQAEGPDAVTTRGVAQRAGVQPPAIYRYFGDKDGLLEAVAEHVMNAYVAAKAAVVEAAAEEGVDPLVDLEAGWRSQIEFGLANPAIFRLLNDPDRRTGSTAAATGRRVLEARVRRLAGTGRMRVTEPRAVGLIQAAGVGAVQTLLATPPADRDAGLADDIYDAVLARILTPSPEPQAEGDSTADIGGIDARLAGVLAADPDRILAATVAFRAVAPSIPSLSAGERELLTEWLDRALASAG